MTRYFKLTLLLGTLIFSSCATEKYNISPLSNSLSAENLGSEGNEFAYSIDTNVNASEISQLVITFPSFKNDGVDAQVAVLKTHLTNYLQALKANNTPGKKRSLENIENSYKKIQKLRKFLDKDYNETLNRYLVRIKTNLSEIESLSRNGHQ